ncbi:sulfite exporter TauE/SafE family protein [Jiella pelagia]|uniref:Probable membrane transporter protein n=1 Tax=Jiella pelagia TaxID=2986949 RepID=A0ABY7BTR8_9HYPH|nr:sulfite exporter TauE/SafE family protein [Jiella pelagia]WAP66789.1 sulfite exporter TauE/SafE family protein [Jiella pelagia]
MSAAFEFLLLLSIAAFIMGLAKGGLTIMGALPVPLLSLVYDPLHAAVALLPVMLVSDFVAVWLYRREFSARNVWVLVPSGIVGVAAAAVIAPHVSVEVVTFLTGVIGLAFCLHATVLRRVEAQAERPGSIGFGGVMGVLTGATSFLSHNGAPPFHAYVLPQRLPNLTFAGTATLVFAAVNLAKLPAYAAIGLVSDLSSAQVAMTIGAGILGAFAGRAVAGRLPEKVFRAAIVMMLFVLSAWLCLLVRRSRLRLSRSRARAKSDRPSHPVTGPRAASLDGRTVLRASALR